MSHARGVLRVALLAPALALGALAQEAPEEDEPVLAPELSRSALREHVDRPGALMVTRRVEMPAVPLVDGGRVLVSGVGAFEPGLEIQRTLGLRVDVYAPDPEAPPTIHYLDLHEVEALLRALASQDEFVREGRRDVVTETSFASLEGFSVGVEIRAGSPRYRLRGADDERWRELHAGPFGALRSHLGEARDRLFNDP